jgi:hypothetical protein
VTSGPPSPTCADQGTLPECMANTQSISSRIDPSRQFPCPSRCAGRGFPDSRCVCSRAYITYNIGLDEYPFRHSGGASGVWAPPASPTPLKNTELKSWQCSAFQDEEEASAKGVQRGFRGMRVPQLFSCPHSPPASGGLAPVRLGGLWLVESRPVCAVRCICRRHILSQRGLMHEAWTMALAHRAKHAVKYG